MPHPRGGAADAGQDCAGRDERVGPHAMPRLRDQAVAERRQDGPANQEHHRVEVDEGAEQTHPCPREHPSAQPVRLDEGVVDRRHEHGRRRDRDVREQNRGQQVRRAPLQQQVDGALREGRSSQERPRDVPGAEDRLAPARERRRGFRERAHAVDQHAESPPEQMQPIGIPAIAPQNLDPERDGEQRRGDRDVVDGRCARHQNAPTLRPSVNVRPRAGANWNCSR